MKILNLIRLSLVITTLLFTQSVMAWNQSIELGYGRSHDPNDVKFYNSGFLLSGDIYPLHRNYWSFLTVTGSIGKWYSTAPHDKYLTTAAVSLAVRLYPVSNDNFYNPYFLGSVGPTLLSSRQFGVNLQGSNFTFQWNAGAGVEINHFDINLRYVHYSNAHLIKPDHGFNIQYLLSIGYLFS